MSVMTVDDLDGKKKKGEPFSPQQLFRQFLQKVDYDSEEIDALLGELRSIWDELNARYNEDSFGTAEYFLELQDIEYDALQNQENEGFLNPFSRKEAIQLNMWEFAIGPWHVACRPPNIPEAVWGTESPANRLISTTMLYGMHSYEEDKDVIDTIKRYKKAGSPFKKLPRLLKRHRKKPKVDPKIIGQLFDHLMKEDGARERYGKLRNDKHYYTQRLKKDLQELVQKEYGIHVSLETVRRGLEKTRRLYPIEFYR